MSCDKLVYDLSQEVEGSPNVFIRKDWLNILDNQNQNYQNNQSVIDTSQLSNSNKYMAYREGYLAVPMLLSYQTPSGVGYANPPTNTIDEYIRPNDFAVGLKNWFGSVIHSITLDYNGTTIIQQTPFCNLWNNFKLLTTLSWGDVMTQGPTIGFYPDTSDGWQYYENPSEYGRGIINNANSIYTTACQYKLFNNKYNQPDVIDYASRNDPLSTNSGGNVGMTYRSKWIAYDPLASINIIGGTPYSASFLSKDAASAIWKSHVSKKTNYSTYDARYGTIQISIMGTIYLKHIHSFFNMCPLLKGVFMKLTLNLNNSNCTIKYSTPSTANNFSSPNMSCTSSTCYVGGIQPILVASTTTGGQFMEPTNSLGNNQLSNAINYTTSFGYVDFTVGNKCYNNNIIGASNGKVASSIYLYVPAYTFNPTFEKAYLSNNIKVIKYTDIYQYPFDLGDGDNQQFSQLITNGIGNIKSILIIPFYMTPINEDLTTTATKTVEYLSPFSTAGGGTTAPMATFGNFNIQISGQNAIYNMQRYNFEEWNNQLYGQNAVNGGLTDGLTSGLLNFNDFQQAYAYYYVNVERMLPVEQSVPKSVQIIGTKYGTLPMRCHVFIEFGTSVSIDVLTGARVA
jgi:hypothetical protein